MTLFRSPSFPHLKFDGMLDATVEDGFEGPLCVPDDPVEDLDWYPNFADGSIRAEDLQPPPEYGGGEEDATVELSSSISDDGPKKRSSCIPRKRRCKRFGRRMWSVKPPVWLLNATWQDGRDSGSGNDSETSTGQRMCSHCTAKETPQWRAGPDGPGTLCNACGIRYKSGRLLPFRSTGLRQVRYSPGDSYSNKD